jgi:PPOX class probable F420-dependent enzyme
MLHLDTSTAFGARVDRRLREDVVIWLTTVRPDGTPEPSPVWFLWEGGTLLIYSQPNRPKIRNLERNPRVALNFDGDKRGGDIIVLTGEARLAPGEPPAHQNAAYLAKYEKLIAGIGYTAEQFAKGYSVPIRVTPSKLRGH